jgi:hypothetical protein
LEKNIIFTRLVPLQRSGHTSVIYKGEIFIYGGVLEDNGFKGVTKEEVLIYDIGILT